MQGKGSIIYLSTSKSVQLESPYKVPPFGTSTNYKSQNPLQTSIFSTSSFSKNGNTQTKSSREFTKTQEIPKLFTKGKWDILLGFPFLHFHLHFHILHLQPLSFLSPQHQQILVFHYQHSHSHHRCRF